MIIENMFEITCPQKWLLKSDRGHMSPFIVPSDDRIKCCLLVSRPCTNKLLVHCSSRPIDWMLIWNDHMYSKQSWIWECRSTVLLFCNNTYHVGLCNCSSCFNYPYRHEWEWYTMWRHGSIHHRTLLYSRVHAPPHLQVRETFSTIQNRLWAIIKSKNVLCIEGEKPFWFVRD